MNCPRGTRRFDWLKFILQCDVQLQYLQATSILYGAITLGRMLSECFPNTNVVFIFETVRMLSELDFYTECFPFASRMISVCFQKRPNTSRMFTSTGFLPERFPYVFRMLSEYGELKKIYTETMFRDIALSVALHRFDARTHNGRISHII